MINDALTKKGNVKPAFRDSFKEQVVEKYLNGDFSATPNGKYAMELVESQFENESGEVEVKTIYAEVKITVTSNDPFVKKETKKKDKVEVEVDIPELFN